MLYYLLVYSLILIIRFPFVCVIAWSDKLRECEELSSISWHENFHLDGSKQDFFFQPVHMLGLKCHQKRFDLITHIFSNWKSAKIFYTWSQNQFVNKTQSHAMHTFKYFLSRVYDLSNDLSIMSPWIYHFMTQHLRVFICRLCQPEMNCYRRFQLSTSHCKIVISFPLPPPPHLLTGAQPREQWHCASAGLPTHACSWCCIWFQLYPQTLFWHHHHHLHLHQNLHHHLLFHWMQ